MTFQFIQTGHFMAEEKPAKITAFITEKPNASIATAELRKGYNLVMETVIPQRQLRNNNAEILDRVEAGESFVVTRNGVAVADVVPHVTHSGPPRFPKTADLQARHRASGAIRPDREAWMRDIREADAVIDDDPFAGRA